MIISHKHRFIFLHTRKCAGSSIKVVLANQLGAEDILIGSIKDYRLRGLTPPKAMTRIALRHPHWPSVFYKLARGSYWSFVNNSIKQHYSHTLGSRPEHAPAEAVKAAFPVEWQSYKKFCVVRNPWDQLWSEYKWRYWRKTSKFSFKEFLEKTERYESYTSNWLIYTIKNKPQADRLLRYEDLKNELEHTFEWLGLKQFSDLPQAKSMGNKSADNYRAHYDSESQALVGRVRAKEIGYFGYEF